MSALIWDSTTQAFKGAETPKVWDSSANAWKDAEGKIWNETAQAWEDAWSGKPVDIILADTGYYNQYTWQVVAGSGPVSYNYNGIYLPGPEIHAGINVEFPLSKYSYIEAQWYKTSTGSVSISYIYTSPMLSTSSPRAGTPSNPDTYGYEGVINSNFTNISYANGQECRYILAGTNKASMRITKLILHV